MKVGTWLENRFEISRGDSGQNIRSMEGLRGLAVFLVFLVHYTGQMTPLVKLTAASTLIAGSLHTMGNAGVDMFFVLSGYLIYGSLISREQSFGGYIKRRIKRIYPTFGVVFVIYVALSLVFPSESKLPPGGWPAVLFLAENAALVPGIFKVEPMITVAWSLSYEFFFYLAVPAVIAVLGLRRRTPGQRLAVIALQTAAIAAYSLSGGPVQLIMFLAGMTLYEVVKHSGMRISAGGVIGAAALILGLLSTLLPYSGPVGFTIRTMLLFAAFLVLCLDCFTSVSPLTRGFCWRPLRWLGNMSYSYYLLHGLALKACFLVIGRLVAGRELGDAFFYLMLAVTFAITLIPTAALYLTVERPLSLSKPKPTQAASSVTLAPPPLVQTSPIKVLS